MVSWPESALEPGDDELPPEVASVVEEVVAEVAADLEINSTKPEPRLRVVELAAGEMSISQIVERAEQVKSHERDHERKKVKFKNRGL
jgi:hypothetical protein